MLRAAVYLLLTVAFTVFHVQPLAAQDSNGDDKTIELTSRVISGLAFRGTGPAFMSGRIGDISIDPIDKHTWYVAVASGNVWKTTNAGTTFEPIFDSYGSYSIGCIAVDPNNRHVVWVGTGENNSQRSVGYGDGVYKSIDGGKKFENMGLENSEHIGMIRIDPRNSDVVYVAAQGPLWSAGGDRGLYKTTDGGETWKRVLEISEHTGISEVHFDPGDPDVLYAVAYQRRRHVWTLINGGPECGIHKSTDAGATWKEINSGLPPERGRIGLAVSPVNPDVLYAIVEAAKGKSGFFRSSDRGENWSRQSDYVARSRQYYQEIFADPNVFDRVYSMDVRMMVTENGGKDFDVVPRKWKHVDDHALVIDPDDSDHLIAGCDGGIYETWDQGDNWKYFANLPVTQFYKIAVDNDVPFYNVYGGTQDNATQGGPSRTNTIHGITNCDWFITIGGDGFDPAVDPENPNIIYSQSQYGGLARYDRKSGQRISIKPREDKEGPPLRWNWDSALLLSPHDNTRLYYGAQFLFRSDDRGNSWQRISPDLTRNIDRNKLEVMGRVWGVDAPSKNWSTSFYGTIVAVSESPLQENLLYVGTDDGLIQVSPDGGEAWRRYDKFAGVPETTYVNDIQASLHDTNTVYAAFNNHKRGDFKPYILKSTDRGQSWKSIVGNLPERGSVYAIAQDHVNEKLLFVGTEFGVFCTVDEGENWVQLKKGIPTILVRDLEIQRRESDLVASSFGRGFYILDDYSPLRHVNDESLQQDAIIFPVKRAWQYVEASPLGWRKKGTLGANFFAAPNPEFGARFTYYLKETLETRKSRRQERDRELAKEGKDVFYPSWEELKAEDREEEPQVILTIRDSDGNVVRRLPGKTSSGIHRTTWDFQYPGYGPTELNSDGWGPMAVPGMYTVELHQRVADELGQLVGPTTFQVETLGLETLPAEDRDELLAFQQKTGELQRAVMGTNEAAKEAEERLKYIEKTIETTPSLDLALLSEVREMQLRLLDLREAITGDPTKSRRHEPAMDGILSRIGQIVWGHWSSTSPATETFRKNYEIAAQEFTEIIGDLRTLIETDLPALEARLEQAGAPWTPGRGVPEWPR